MSDITLHCGDCLEYMRTLPEASVDAVVTDPPYGTTACKWDEVIPFEPMWEQLRRIIRPRGAIVLFGAQPFASALVMSNPKWFKYEWIWHKSRPSDHISAKLKPMREHENILVFSDGTIANKSKRIMTYNPQGLVYRPQVERRPGRKVSRINGDRPCLQTEYTRQWANYPRTVLRYANPNHGALHPTQKPVDLLEYLVRTYTDEGDTVFDFAMGSGTTGVACVQTGRKFIGCEISEDYFEIAQRRIAEAQMQPALLETA